MDAMSDTGIPALPVHGRSPDRADVRARLLEAAEEIFGRRGFYNASIAEITRRAGIAQGSFYLHFPSKEEIFRELMRSRGEEMRDALAGVGEPGSPDWATQREAFRRFFEWIVEHPWFYRVTRQAEFVDPALREGWYREFAKRYVGLLEKGMETGLIPKADPEVLGWAVMGAADFTAMRWVVWEAEGRSMPPDKIDAFMEIVARLLGTCPDPGVEGEDFPRARTRL